MIDTNKALELTDGTPATFNGFSSPERGRPVIRVDLDTKDGASCLFYQDTGEHFFHTRPNLRNKVDVNLVDITKPMYVDGVEVKLRCTEKFNWPQVSAHDGRGPWVNVSNSPTGNFTYYIRDGHAQTNPDGPRLSNDPNFGKETVMLDLNKPLTVNGKDAKVIHTFPNGNLAVVLDGATDVFTFTPQGNCTNYSYGNYILKNKIVETVRFVNVYPDWYSAPNRVKVRDKTDTFDTDAAVHNCKSNGAASAFVVKQTLRDGKVVKSEIVS